VAFFLAEYRLRLSALSGLYYGACLFFLSPLRSSSAAATLPSAFKGLSAFSFQLDSDFTFTWKG